MVTFASSIGLEKFDTFTKKELEKAREEDAKKDIRMCRISVKDFTDQIA